MGLDPVSEKSRGKVNNLLIHLGIHVIVSSKRNEPYQRYALVASL